MVWRRVMYSFSTQIKRLFLSLFILFASSTILPIEMASFRYSVVDQERLIASQNSVSGVGIFRIEFEIYQESSVVQSVGAAETEHQISILVPELEAYADDIAVASEVFNYPNPFRLSEGTTIGYTLSKDMDIQIRIYNIFGQMVFMLEFDEGENGGMGSPYYNKVAFSRIHLNGGSLPASVYFYILVNNGDVIGKGKMAILP